MGFKKSKNKEPKSSKKWKGSRSETYSDDYRITPDPLGIDQSVYCTHQYCPEGCGELYSCCLPNGEYCSQGCCPPANEIPIQRNYSPSRYSRNHNKDDVKRRSSSSSSRRHGGLDVILVDEGISDPRRTFSAENCSCSSCNSCSWNSYTKVKLKKNLFQSQGNATFATNDDVFVNPSRLDRRSNYPKDRPRERSPYRKKPSSPLRDSGTRYSDPRSQTYISSGDSKLSGRKETRGNLSKNRKSGNSRSGNEASKPYKYPDEYGASSNADKGGTSQRSSNGSSNGGAEKKRSSSPRRVSRSPSRVMSPERRKPPTNISKRNSNSSSISGGQDGRGGKKTGNSSAGSDGKDDSKGKASGTQQETASGSRGSPVSKKDLLTQMVSQTKEHRKQIRSLENELERLRSSDVLSKCEVSVNDVEWRPGDIVGEGSFSTVYRGTYCGTEVAVKELKFKLSQDDKNYFKSEAALLQQLHHPRVVLLMGVCTGAARPFMLLEYLSGGTLHNYIHTTTRERIDHAAYFIIAKDVAQGINYLHRHDPQVLHLDLKSMNVLLDNYTRAKIADFGFSILRRSRGNNVAQRGSIRGTPAWMSPELLTTGEVSPKCDVYSYAIILWEMLTAQHPFKGLDVYQIMQTVEAGGRPPLLTAGVSQDLRELITSCWAQNPSLRPSFEEILGALETAAIPPSWRGVLNKAAIAPSFLSDLNTARTIIGMVEHSVELIANPQITEIKHKKSYKIDDSRRPPIEERIRKLKASSASPQRSPNSSRSPSKKPSFRGENHYDRKVRATSPSKDRNPVIRRESSRNQDQRRANQERPRNRSNQRTEPQENTRDRRREKIEQLIDEVVFSEARDRISERRQIRNNEKYPNNKQGKLEKNKRERKGFERADQKKYNIRPEQDSFIKEIYQIRENRRAVENKIHYNEGNKLRNERRSRSPEKEKRGRERIPDNNREWERYQDNEESLYSSDQDTSHGYRIGNRLNDSRDSLGESPEASWTSMEGDAVIASDISYRDMGRYQTGSDSIDERSHSVESRGRGRIRRYAQKSPSPQRRLPEQNRHSRSPQRRSRMKPVDNPHEDRLNKRREPIRYGPLILTAEQLLDQKQRLRPVRPSALSDLDLLPQHSLNDISYLLKKAMDQRRDALKDVLSGRDTLRSENIEWSDWH